MSKLETAVCKYCGKTFIKYRGNQTYCNQTCAHAAVKERVAAKRKTYIKICVVCGAQFETTNSARISCSENCQRLRRNYIERRREKAERELYDMPVIKAEERAVMRKKTGNVLDETLKTMKDPVYEYAQRQKAATLAATAAQAREWMNKQISG